eukprot:TRINITY_DN2585_c0_g1_i8.p1 TRINITY_DN2585_c0_g1~~TRINITY_DN2585_c0_g1_i8.p1  ORF type:complete len:346 (-),score=71.20 TRINITY_DN2585_c0_g1_i8:18-1055(-)
MKLISVLFLLPFALGIWNEPKVIDHVVINLDLPPEQRYTQVLLDRVNQHGWNYTYAPIVEYYDLLVPPELQPALENISTDLDKYLPEEYVREMNGLYDTVVQLGYQDQLTFGMIVALNMIYEWTSFCTSIVAEDTSGRMWHGRNLDWNFDGYSLWNITMIMDYQSGGVTVFSSVGWAGYIGILSGVKKGFTVTVDQREHYEPEGIRGNMESLMNGSSLVGLMLRDTFKSNQTFDQAIPILSDSYIASSVYLIVGGYNKDEGAVITRDRLGAADIWKYGNPDAHMEDWYLVQTNYDHWLPDKPDDHRQTDAIIALDKMGRANLNADKIGRAVQQECRDRSRMPSSA